MKGSLWVLGIIKNELMKRPEQKINFDFPQKVLETQQKQKTNNYNDSISEFDSETFIKQLTKETKYDSNSEEYVIITGASGGIGEEITSFACSNTKYNIIMAVRNIKKAEEVKERIIKKCGQHNIELLRLDLSSIDSVIEFSNTLLERKIKIVRLMNNAGTMVPDRITTKDGYEQTVETNYICPLLLTLKLLPLMPPESRIVNMLSLTYAWTSIDKKLFTEGMDGTYYRLPCYCNSKQAFLYATLRLSDALKERKIHVAGSDPGIVSTGIITMGKWFDPIADLVARPFMYTPEQGASPAIKLLFDEEPRDGCLYAVHGKREIGKDYTENPLKDCVFDQSLFLLKHYF